MKVHKRMLSLLLTAIMLTAMMAFAGGSVYADSITVKDKDMLYTALGDSRYDTITVSGNLELSGSISVNRPLTIQGSGSITIHSRIDVLPYAHLTLAGNIAIEGGDGVGLVWVNRNGGFTIQDNASLSSFNNTIITDFYSQATININGGSISNSHGNGIVSYWGTVNITGGTINAAKVAVDMNDWSQGVISGGSIHTSGAYSPAVHLDNQSSVGIQGKANISGHAAIEAVDSVIFITSSSDLKLSGEVGITKIYSTSAEHYRLINQLQKPITLKKGSTGKFTISGVAAGLEFASLTPPNELNASIEANTVTLAPEKEGSYELRIGCKYKDSKLFLTIPVTVTGTSGSSNENTGGSPRPAIPETGAEDGHALFAVIALLALTAAAGATLRFGKRARYNENRKEV